MNPKTKKSKAAAWLPAAVYRELLKLREAGEDDTEVMWIFRSTWKRRGRLMPIDYHYRPFSLKIEINNRVNAVEWFRYD